MLSVLLLKVTFLGDMKRKVFFHTIIFTDFWTSWAHTDPAYCNFGFTLCVNRTEDIQAGGSPDATIGQGARNHSITISFSQ